MATSDEFMREFNVFNAEYPLPIGDPSSGAYVPTKKDMRDWVSAIEFDVADESLALMKTGNLSGLRDVAASRANLELGDLATLNLSDLSAFSEGLSFAGGWDASSGSFPLVTDTGDAVVKGDFFDVTGSGVVDGVSFSVGDRLISLVENPSETVYSQNWHNSDTASFLEPISSDVDANTNSILEQRDDYGFSPTGNSIVSSDQYSAFSQLLRFGSNLINVYHHGRNHGQSDSNAVCLPQKPISAGNISINGNEQSGGIVSVGGATQVILTSTLDDTGVTFTITGSKDGSPVEIVSAGPNSESITIAGLIDTINQVSVDGPTTGDVSVGLFRIASNISAKVSTDDGYSWSSTVVIGDGMSDGESRCYYPSAGIRKDGSIIVCYQRQDIETGVFSPKFRTSTDGVNWSIEQPMVVSGYALSFYAFYGKMAVTPSGKLLVTAYLGADQVLLVSSDNGDTWVSKFVRAETGGVTTSEASIAVYSERIWFYNIRNDNTAGTLFHMVTTDAGDTWTDYGQIGSMPTTGGYKSHEAGFVTVNNTRMFVLIVMARSSSLNGPNPNTIIIKWGKASQFVSGADGLYSGEEVLVNGLGVWPRDGYPSFVYDPNSGETLLSYHRETGERTSNVETKSFNIFDVIYGGETVPFTPTIVGTSGPVATTNLQSGRVTRMLDHVRFDVDVRVDGSITSVGLLSVTLGDFVFDTATPSYLAVGPCTGMLAGKDQISAITEDGTNKVNIWHTSGETSSSGLEASEVGSNFRFRASGFAKVK